MLHKKCLFWLLYATQAAFVPLTYCSNYDLLMYDATSSNTGATHTTPPRSNLLSQL